MTRTVFGDDHDVVPHSARTYTPYLVVDGRPRWLIALQRGELLRRRSNLVGLRTALPLNDGSPGPWGIGGRVNARRSHPAFYGVGAAKAAFGVYPQDDLAVVVLTNLSADMGLPFLDGIAAQFLPDLRGN
jgi:CubicO group peptidase (beta-lactamase class C family)